MLRVNPPFCFFLHIGRTCRQPSSPIRAWLTGELLLISLWSHSGLATPSWAFINAISTLLKFECWVGSKGWASSPAVQDRMAGGSWSGLAMTGISIMWFLFRAMRYFHDEETLFMTLLHIFCASLVQDTDSLSDKCRFRNFKPVLAL